MKWDSKLYDDRHNFVAEYGKGLLEYIPDKPNQHILDLGCGTGTLTAQLCAYSEFVTGVDSSVDMIERAKLQYDNINFYVCDALNLPFESEFDVVFSNAVFHWIIDHNLLIQNIFKALKSNGMLICEFGANGNISTIDKAFEISCAEYGFEYKSKFNFPTSEHFSNVLNNNGFVVEKAFSFDRPTPLSDGKNGLSNWMRQFYASELAELPKNTQNEIIANVENITKNELWNGIQWVADYRRLRAIACKI